MRSGHIAGVQELPGLFDEAVANSHQLFEARKSEFDGFEVWERARMVAQIPTPIATQATLISSA